MKTVCPNCKAINDVLLTDCEIIWCEGRMFDWYPMRIYCFYCHKPYVWAERWDKKGMRGVPVPGVDG